MAKKKSHEGGHGNSERWLLTYADMITLLLVLFIILYSMSQMSLAKFDQMIPFFSKAFGGGYSIVGKGNAGVMAMNYYPNRKNPKLQKTQTRTTSQLQKEIADKKVRVTADARGVVISLASDYYYSSGEAALTSEARDILIKIFTILDTIPNNIRIEGHTDNLPIVPGSALSVRYPTNWELSAQRAINVLKSLESDGISPKRLSALGYADNRPLKSNETVGGRAFNRRVEIIILDDMNPSIAEQPPAPLTDQNPLPSSVEAEPTPVTSPH